METIKRLFSILSLPTVRVVKDWSKMYVSNARLELTVCIQIQKNAPFVILTQNAMGALRYL